MEFFLRKFTDGTSFTREDKDVGSCDSGYFTLGMVKFL